jgi:hypothetical protein
VSRFLRHIRHRRRVSCAPYLLGCCCSVQPLSSVLRPLRHRRRVSCAHSPQ